MVQVLDGVVFAFGAELARSRAYKLSHSKFALFASTEARIEVTGVCVWVCVWVWICLRVWVHCGAPCE
jgi:hypothetical protein